MPKTMIYVRIRTLAAAALGVLVLSACSPGDVELNGKIFDAMGVSGTQKTGSIPKVAARAPLVVPPSLERLPEPGSAPSIAAAPDFPVDPETTVGQKQAKLAAEQAAYCKEHYDKPIALGDRNTALTAVGPLGPCQPSAFKNLTGNSPAAALEKQ